MLHSQRHCRSSRASQSNAIVAVWITAALVLGHVTHQFITRCVCQDQDTNPLGHNVTSETSTDPPMPLPRAPAPANLNVCSTIVGALALTVVAAALTLWFRTSPAGQPLTHSAVQKRTMQALSATKGLQCISLVGQEDPFTEQCGTTAFTNHTYSDCSQLYATNCTNHVVASHGLTNRAVSETAFLDNQQMNGLSRQISVTSINSEPFEATVRDAQSNQGTFTSPARVLAAHSIRRYKLNPDARRTMPRGQPTALRKSNSTLSMPRIGSPPPLSRDTIHENKAKFPVAAR